MRVALGCELTYDLPQPLPMIAMLNTHYSQAPFLEQPDTLTTRPAVPVESYRDGFGNWCNRLTAPAGRFSLGTSGVIRIDGMPDQVDPAAPEHAVQTLAPDTLVYLLGSRYCETDVLMEDAWRLFGSEPAGAPRVQAICNHVHNHVSFGYEHSSQSWTAAQPHAEARGGCRDCTQLAITFCRCLNIPARYCTGYISAIGPPKQTLMQDCNRRNVH